MKVSELIIEILNEAGVSHVFGTPGDEINDLLEAIRAQKELQFVHVVHEESGALAASAQAKLSGKLSACVGSAGPGALHLLNGLYDAKMDSAPVIAITGQVERCHMSSRYHQEVDIPAVFSDVAVFNATVVSTEQLPGLIVRACRAAIEHRGVAHLSIPSDLLGAAVEGAAQRGSVANMPRKILLPDPAAVDAAAGLLTDSRKVAILAGLGCKNAIPELLELAQLLEAPVIRSLRAKGLVPEEHPLALGGHGLLGSRPSARAIDECDTLLMIGSDFPYEEFYPDHHRVIQVDIDSEKIGSRHPVAVGIAADAKLTIEALTQRIARQEVSRDRGFLESLQNSKDDWVSKADDARSDRSSPIRPQHLAYMAGKCAETPTIFSCDTGAVTVWGARHLPVPKGSQFTLSSSLGTMGYALPAAIGAQLLDRDKQVVALVGDGSLQMLLGEFVTAVRYRLPINLVVFNNGKLGLIEMEQRVAGLPEYSTELGDLNYAAFAELAGGWGRRVESSDELPRALREAYASKLPAIVDVRIDSNELTRPPRVEFAHAVGFVRSKVAEVIGRAEPEGDSGRSKSR